MAYINWIHVEVVHDARMRGLDDWRSVCKETGISRAEYLEARHHLRKADDSLGIALELWSERQGAELDLVHRINEFSERLARVELSQRSFFNGRADGYSL